jgi:HAD superfamily hydrolase (TIGR01490 family)
MNAPSKIGAFFDLDGTLLKTPSLEWRFIGYLLERDEIATVNVTRWVAHAAKTILSGGRRAVFANKYYLAGLRESIVEEWERTFEPESLSLFAAGIERLRWHLESGHRVVLVTGTVAPLARVIHRHLPRGVEVRATELEIVAGCFTGRICGAHLSFQEKARVIRETAADCNLDLSRSFAYGNEMSDAAMLEAVGHPAAVNASWRLKREARRRAWSVRSWAHSREIGRGPRTAGLVPKDAR